MILFRVRNVILVVFLFSIFFLSEQPVDADPITLFFILPALLIKAGLAAPLVLALLAKLAILFGLKLKLLLPLLALLSLTGIQSPEQNTTYGRKSGTADDGEDGFGRIKRSTDFVESIVGQIHLDEDELLESILRVDSRNCGERLLCEVAAAQKGDQRIEEHEAALISFFGADLTEDNSALGNDTARNVYSKALMTGLQAKDCFSKYPSCPYGRSQMANLIKLVFGLHLPGQEEQTVQSSKPQATKKDSPPIKKKHVARTSKKDI